MIYFIGVAGVLLEEKLGCLENEIDPTVENFINAVKTMFLTGHQLMVFAEFHRKWNTRTWRDHVEAWDQIYSKCEYFTKCFLKEFWKLLLFSSNGRKSVIHCSYSTVGSEISWYGNKEKWWTAKWHYYGLLETSGYEHKFNHGGNLCEHNWVTSSWSRHGECKTRLTFKIEK